jgi:hypothetical protein
VTSRIGPTPLLLPLLLLLLLLPAGPAVAATKKLEVALQDDGVFVGPGSYDRDRALQQARDLGVTRIRVNATWSQLSLGSSQTTRPAPVEYDWSRIDSLIDAAAPYGIRIQLTLTGPAPAWAAANRRIGVFGPNPDSFGDFARAAATHFKGRVDRYSIWNEPNYVSWLQPFDLNAALYRELYVAAYKQIKRADKKAQVLIGETAPYAIKKRSTAPLAFLRNVTCTRTTVKTTAGSGTDPTPDTTIPARARVHSASVSSKPPVLLRGGCKPLVTDGFAHHPYDYRHRPDYAYKGTDNATLGSIGRLSGTLSALAKLGALRTPKGKAAPIFLTEYGYFASGKYALPDTARSAYLKKAYTIAQRDPAVVQLLQYGLVAPPPSDLGAYFDLSLVAADGTPGFAFNGLAAWSQTAAGRGQIVPPGVAITLPPAPQDRGHKH